ncbi:carbohydrate-binding protein [Actinocrispum wychmicini]|uniref:carbohydrate-binding protein n=1 Tax=Actinocrispum wychmicini TaxID=1213861 RepID=UPI00104F4649|nr:carbohydrate-binding protein [Actinocrispum wychmicini]
MSASATTGRGVDPATAPDSGHSVAGAVYGDAAARRADTAADHFRTSHQRMVDSITDAQPQLARQIHNWWGTFPNGDRVSTGLMATQSVDPSLRLTSRNDFLYTPTMKPANGSCIEVVTVHTSGTPQVWAWDWCRTVGPAVELDVTSSFLSKYTTTVHGLPAYTVRNVKTGASNNTWTASLFNVTTNSWDTLFTSSGTDQSKLAYGWSMFEFYSDVTSSGQVALCRDIARLSFESSSIQVQLNGTWTAATGGNSKWMPSAAPDPRSYGCTPLAFHIVNNNADWVVNQTP